MKPSKKSKVLIVMGPPGAGKGTQAELLAEKLSFYHLQTREIIEENFRDMKKGDFVMVDGKKYFLADEKKLRDSGKLMSPPLITFWVENKVKELAREGQGIVSDGCPRTLYEGKKVIPLFKKLYGAENIRIVLIKLTPEETIRRNSHRRTCELMHHPILYSEETAKLTKCPLDGSKLVSRKDDTPETIKVRLKEYRERTVPLIDYFKKEGLSVNEIDGSPSPADVFKDILKLLKGV